MKHFLIINAFIYTNNRIVCLHEKSYNFIFKVFFHEFSFKKYLFFELAKLSLVNRKFRMLVRNNIK